MSSALRRASGSPPAGGRCRPVRRRARSALGDRARPTATTARAPPRAPRPCRSGVARARVHEDGMLFDRTREVDERGELAERSGILAEPVVDEAEQLADRGRVRVGVAQRPQDAGRVAFAPAGVRLCRPCEVGLGAAALRPAMRASSSPASVRRRRLRGHRRRPALGRRPGTGLPRRRGRRTLDRAQHRRRVVDRAPARVRRGPAGSCGRGTGSRCGSGSGLGRAGRRRASS